MLVSVLRYPLPAGRQLPSRPGAALRVVEVLPYVVVAAFLSVLYVRTLLPSAGYHMDAAKFGYLGQVLGTGHPPGEPLYLMLNAGWVQLLPIGDPAWRANLLSAVLAVSACLVLLRVSRQLGVGPWVAAAGTAVIGVSQLFWQQAVIAEVYTLNALLVAVVLCLLLAWNRTRKGWLLVAALGAFELSFSNHPTGVVLLPGLAVFLWRTGGYRVLFRWPNLLVLAGCGLVTVATYGYIVWRTLDPQTPYVELSMHDLSSFWAGITAQQFQGAMFAYGPVEFVTQRAPAALQHLWWQYYALAAAGVWGLVVLWRQHRNAATLTGLWALVVAVFTMEYSVFDAEVFYFVAWMMVGVWITVAAQDLVRRVPRWVVGRGRLRWLAVIPVLATAAAPLVLAGVTYPRVDLSDAGDTRAVSQAASALPTESIVFTPSLLQYHQWNSVLLPTGAGERRSQYVDVGSGEPDTHGEPGNAGPISALARYCSSDRPTRLEWTRRTVPPDLPVFVYTDHYAQTAATYGYPTRQVRGALYRIGCDRFHPRPT